MKKIVRKNAEVEVRMYDRIKYDRESKKDFSVTYEAGKIAYFDVLTGAEAEEFEKTIDEDSIDENHEYLMLYFADSENVASFRNSYCDLFVL